MKKIKLLLAILIAFTTLQSASAQSDKTERAKNFDIKKETIKVKATCNMDKRCIETAAYSIDVVKSAVWDEYRQAFTLTHDVFKKDAADNVQTKIASVGNDTQKYKADDAAYSKLPDCCHYLRVK